MRAQASLSLISYLKFSSQAAELKPAHVWIDAGDFVTAVIQPLLPGCITFSAELSYGIDLLRGEMISYG